MQAPIVAVDPVAVARRQVLPALGPEQLAHVHGQVAPARVALVGFRTSSRRRLVGAHALAVLALRIGLASRRRFRPGLAARPAGALPRSWSRRRRFARGRRSFTAVEEVARCSARAGPGCLVLSLRRTAGVRGLSQPTAASCAAAAGVRMATELEQSIDLLQRSPRAVARRRQRVGHVRPRTACGSGIDAGEVLVHAAEALLDLRDQLAHEHVRVPLLESGGRLRAGLRGQRDEEREAGPARPAGDEVHGDPRVDDRDQPSRGAGLPLGSRIAVARPAARRARDADVCRFAQRG